MFRTILPTTLRKTVLTLAASTVLAGPAAAQPASETNTNKRSIAVFPVVPTNSTQAAATGKGAEQTLGLATISESIEAAMPTILAGTNKFDVQASGQLQQALGNSADAQQIASANSMDPRVAQQLSANGISHAVIVQIDSYNDTGTKTLNTAARRNLVLTAVANIYNVTTQELVIGLPFRPDEKEFTCRNCVAQTGGDPFGTKPLIEYGDELATGLADLVIEHFYPMQVIAVRRGQLVINIGSSGSHKTGDRYDIVIQEAFEDP
ncbi:MAG: hypothetical protein AAF108_12135, partial [Planctomycetota bacterium]